MKNILKPVEKFICSKGIRNTFKFFFLRKSTMKYINYIYEKSPHILTEIFVRIFSLPGFNYKWKIYLSNKKNIITEIRKDNYQSLELALSYKWHDYALRKAETLLNDYYDKKYAYFDIGANVGLRSIYSISTERPVVLFEPNYELKKITLNLFGTNNYKNYRIENIALSDKISEVDFYISENSYESSIELNSDIKYSKRISVKTYDLDSYHKNNFPELIPKIIKIDVEGNEVNVIRGSFELIENFSPSLIIEVLKNSTNFAELYKMLFKYNYKIFALKNGVFPDIKKIDENEILSGKHNSNNYLFTKETDIINKIK